MLPKYFDVDRLDCGSNAGAEAGAEDQGGHRGEGQGLRPRHIQHPHRDVRGHWTQFR